MNIFMVRYLPMSMMLLWGRMSEEKPSSSAEMVTAGRAAESMKPKDERICYDPFAQYFLGWKFTLFSKSRLLTKIALWRAEQISPGTVGCLAGRTRYIDEYLQKCIDDGIEQLVILGAGYDSRPYRFDGLKEKV